MGPKALIRSQMCNMLTSPFSAAAIMVAPAPANRAGRFHSKGTLLHYELSMK